MVTGSPLKNNDYLCNKGEFLMHLFIVNVILIVSIFFSRVQKVLCLRSFGSFSCISKLQSIQKNCKQKN